MVSLGYNEAKCGTLCGCIPGFCCVYPLCIPRQKNAHVAVTGHAFISRLDIGISTEARVHL